MELAERLGIDLIMTIMSYFDIKYQKIEKKWIALFLGFAGICAVAGRLGVSEEFGMTVWGLLPGGIMLMLSALTKQIGAGDGIIVLILGLVTGLQHCILALNIALFLGALFSGAGMVLRKLRPSARIPFVPFLLGGELICQLSNVS